MAFPFPWRFAPRFALFADVPCTPLDHSPCRSQVVLVIVKLGARKLLPAELSSEQQLAPPPASIPPMPTVTDSKRAQSSFSLTSLVSGSTHPHTMATDLGESKVEGEVEGEV